MYQSTGALAGKWAPRSKVVRKQAEPASISSTTVK